MDLFRERRSIRSYKTDPIREKDLSAILEAGDYAPSGGNSQSTHRLVILNQDILERLRVLVQQAFAGMELTESMYQSLKNSIALSKKGNYIYDYHAPVLIVVANQKNYGNAMADSACMLENMMLKATELGIGSCWINQLHWLDENKEIRNYLETLGLLPEETITGGLALGYANAQPQNELPRKGNPVTFIR